MVRPAAAFERSRALYLELASLRMEIRALSEELASILDPLQRAALVRRRQTLEVEWDLAHCGHMDAVREGMAAVRGLTRMHRPRAQ